MGGIRGVLASQEKYSTSAFIMMKVARLSLIKCPSYFNETTILMWASLDYFYSTCILNRRKDLTITGVCKVHLLCSYHFQFKERRLHQNASQLGITTYHANLLGNKDTPCKLPCIKQWDKPERTNIASIYLYTRARMFSIVATSGWSWPDVFSRSSKACLHRGTATS